MSIPESRLESWSAQGAVTTSKNTYEAIRTALNASPRLTGRDIEIYLQGSYKNTTNIRRDSDVDIVVQLNDTFYSDERQLTLEQRVVRDRAYQKSTYSYFDFRHDVADALQKAFGEQSIKDGNKCLKVKGNSSRLDADVVPCCQYRRYSYFYSDFNQSYSEGMCFWTKNEMRQVVNFPKLHYANGVNKNQCTNSWYKPVIRMFKNARTYLVDNKDLGSDIAPSYFVECLMFNVPHECYGGSYTSSYLEVVNWLNAIDRSNFVCQNGQVYLFGPTEEQWSDVNAKQFLSALISLWFNYK